MTGLEEKKGQYKQMRAYGHNSATWVIKPDSLVWTEMV